MPPLFQTHLRIGTTITSIAFVVQAVHDVQARQEEHKAQSDDSRSFEILSLAPAFIS